MADTANKGFYVQRPMCKLEYDPEDLANAEEALSALIRHASPCLTADLSSPSFIGKSYLAELLSVCVSMLAPKRLQLTNLVGVHESSGDLSMLSPIFVRTHIGKTVMLEVHTSTSVEVFKKMLARKEGIAMEEFRLSYCGKILSNNFTLADYNIQRYSTLDLNLYLRGGSTSKWVNVVRRSFPIKWLNSHVDFEIYHKVKPLTEAQQSKPVSQNWFSWIRRTKEKRSPVKVIGKRMSLLITPVEEYEGDGKVLISELN